MPTWPDKEEALLRRFVESLKLRGHAAPRRSVLRGFQRFVCRRTARLRLTENTISAWLRQRSKASLRSVLAYGHLVNAFLDWLVEQRALAGNPIAEARRKYEARSTAAVLLAMAQSRPEEALKALRPLPRYGSHLGLAMREHVERMRTLGFRYTHENRFLHFDRFLQQRAGAAHEPLSRLVREYAETAASAATRLARIKVGSLLAKSLNRCGTPTVAPSRDRMLVREALRNRCKPYIYSEEEVQLLLETAPLSLSQSTFTTADALHHGRARVLCRAEDRRDRWFENARCRSE